LFIDGTQFGSTLSNTGTRSADIGLLRIGENVSPTSLSDFLADDLQIFSTVQHTSDYTPSTVVEYKYNTSKAELPEFEYTGNAIKEFISFSGTATGCKFVVDDKYWDGSSWVVSDGTYSQANTISDVNTNIESITPDGKVLNIDVVFDNSNTTQGSITYLTIGYTGRKYLESSIILPEMEKIGDGTIKLFNSLTATKSGSPRFQLQIGRSGNYLYFSGSAWVVSDGTYAQSTDLTTWNLHCSTLDVDGEIYGQFKVLFAEGIDQDSISELTANMCVEEYPTDNPYVQLTFKIYTEGLEGFDHVATIAGSDLIKYILSIDDVLMYHDGSDWITSDGTYEQSNTEAEIETQKSTLISVAKTLKISRIFFHSYDSTSTPELDTLTIDYEYAQEQRSDILRCIVAGYNKDNAGEISTSLIYFRMIPKTDGYNGNITLRSGLLTITPNSFGYFSQLLIRGNTYKFYVDDEEFTATIPNKATASFLVSNGTLIIS